MKIGEGNLERKGDSPNNKQDLSLPLNINKIDFYVEWREERMSNLGYR